MNNTLEHISSALCKETQITSYIVGGVKKDVSADMLKGMSL